MAFSEFLQSRRDACKALVAALSDSFAYVSVLGSHVTSSRISADKRSSNIGEGALSECGFVVKLSNGRAFMEYSLDDITGDLTELAAKITAAVQIDPSLADQAVSVPLPADEAMTKSFVRESDVDLFTDADLLAFCAEMRDMILAEDERIINCLVAAAPYTVSKLFVTKQRELDQTYSWVNINSLVTIRDGEKMVQTYDGAYSHLVREAMDAFPAVGKELAKRAAKLLTAKPIEPGVYDVITDSTISGLIAHEAFGHGVEMDQFVKDRALAKHYVGKPVASPICNMRDGAASALSAASYFFDDDGVLAHDTQIIKDGILVAGISDLASASVLGTEATGNGRRESYTHKSYTRMTNTFFDAGKDKLEDMIASIKHGYMLFQTNNGMEDPKNWQIQCTAEYGIEIVDGKLTENYVSPVVMSGYVPDLLMSISMVSDTCKVIGSGSCGKGYKEWVRVADGGPALKVRVKLA